MRILLVTGKVAEEEIRKAVAELDVEVDFCVMPVTVAAFLTPSFVAENLRKRDLTGYDMILLPGTVNGDVTEVEETTGVPTFKGPLRASEIPLVLDTDVPLSKTQPANLVIREKIQEEAASQIRRVEENWAQILRDKGGVVIGKGQSQVPVGRGFPMRVIAEIVNAPLLELEAIKKKAEYYEAQGAHIIDVGMLAGKPMPGTIPGIFEEIRAATNLPVSIDSLDPGEISAALDAEVDLVMSLDAGNIEEIGGKINETPAVILPTNMKEGFLPLEPEKRVLHLENNIKLAEEYGVKKIVADLVVEPLVNPGLMNSLISYKIFLRKHEDVPILFGMGNITELIDADSTGVNAAVAALACEVGSNMLHIPEYSDKTIGSVKEAVTASKMMWLARMKGSVPKDLGIDLLVLKEKRRAEPPYDPELETKHEPLRASVNEEFTIDPAGWFNILVDREAGSIVAVHYSTGNEDPDLLIKGKSSREIYQTIIRNNLISRMDHAAYLGKELEKAYIALKLGRSYIQDEPVFCLSNYPYYRYWVMGNGFKHPVRNSR